MDSTDALRVALLLALLPIIVMWMALVATAGRLMRTYREGGPGASAAATKLMKLVFLSGLIPMILALAKGKYDFALLMCGAVVMLSSAYFWRASRKLKKVYG